MTTAKSRAFGLLARTASAFLVGGVVGWCYEQLIGYMTYGHVDPGHGGIGIPFLTIYAAGAAVFELVLGGTEWNARNAAKVLSACAVISGVTEYATGRVMLDAFGAQTWDYRAPGWDWGFVTPDGLLCMRALLTFAVLQIFVVDAMCDRLRRRWGHFDAVMIAAALAVLAWVAFVTLTGRAQWR